MKESPGRDLYDHHRRGDGDDDARPSLSSVAEFLRQYLHECLSIGYPEAPMEQEAILTAERLRHADH